MTATVAKILWLAFIVVWCTLRVRPKWLSRKTPIRYSAWDTREKALVGATLTGLGIIPFVYVTTQFPQFADYPFWPAQGYLGVAAYLGALWLIYRTHRDLGSNWSMSLDLRERHTLVVTGIYAHVRHPMYTGFWLMGIGQLLLLPNWIVGPAGLVGFGALFFGRVQREEEMMVDAFGDEYRSYMRHTARIIPWIY